VSGQPLAALGVIGGPDKPGHDDRRQIGRFRSE
jgi:hypothetical protein